MFWSLQPLRLPRALVAGLSARRLWARAASAASASGPPPIGGPSRPRAAPYRPAPPPGRCRPARKQWWARGFSTFFTTFRQKGLVFQRKLCYNVIVALAPLLCPRTRPRWGPYIQSVFCWGAKPAGRVFFRSPRPLPGRVYWPPPVAAITDEAPAIPRGRGRAGDGATGPPEAKARRAPGKPG